MLVENHQSVRELLIVLTRECALQDEYREILLKEREALKFFKAADIEIFTEKRAEITERIAALQEQRLKLQLSADSAPKKLTEWAQENCQPKDCAKIMVLAEKLKSSVQQTSSLLAEFRGVVDFSLGMVSSTISIIWSATQTVNDTYSGYGQLQKNYLPAGKKALNLLTTA